MLGGFSVTESAWSTSTQSLISWFSTICNILLATHFEPVILNVAGKSVLRDVKNCSNSSGLHTFNVWNIIVFMGFNADKLLPYNIL